MENSIFYLFGDLVLLFVHYMSILRANEVPQNLN